MLTRRYRGVSQAAVDFDLAVFWAKAFGDNLNRGRDSTWAGEIFWGIRKYSNRTGVPLPPPSVYHSILAFAGQQAAILRL